MTTTSGQRLDHTTALGTEPLGRLLWHARSQTTLSVGVYGIYALTNAWFVARGVGATAMAAVNLVAPLLLLLGAVSTALESAPPRSSPAASVGATPPPPRVRRERVHGVLGRGDPHHGRRAECAGPGLLLLANGDERACPALS